MSFGQQGSGFGAAPPGGATPPGGEAPLAHIPFTPEDDANLTGMARFARFAGVAVIASALLTMLAQIVGVLVAHGDTGAIVGQLCGGGVGLLIAGILALFLFRVAKAVEQVVATDDADQLNLVEAFRALKGYFMVKGIVYIVVIALGCLCVGGMFVMGAAVVGAVGAQ